MITQRFRHLCPPHRTTDAQYAEWVVNCFEALDDTPDVTEAQKASRAAWCSEAAICRDWLAAQG